MMVFTILAGVMALYLVFDKMIKSDKSEYILLLIPYMLGISVFLVHVAKKLIGFLLFPYAQSLIKYQYH